MSIVEAAKVTLFGTTACLASMARVFALLWSLKEHNIHFALPSCAVAVVRLLLTRTLHFLQARVRGQSIHDAVLRADVFACRDHLLANPDCLNELV